MLPQGHHGPKIIQPFNDTTQDVFSAPLMTFHTPAGPQAFPSQPYIPRSLGPPQYAFAVRLNPHHALPDTGYQSRPGDGSQPRGASEHMLRRKTPNGTLAAGYDGTPVHWSTEPPPTKHVLLPLSSLPREANRRVLEHPYGALYGQNGHDNSNSYQQQPYQPRTSSSTSGSWDTFGGSGVWTRVPPLFLRGQTMANGANVDYDTTKLAFNGMLVPTVIQPPYQPCLGPTASNDPGIYGPYYADGRYQAYRPAAVRDTGYHSFNRCSCPIQGMPPCNHVYQGMEPYPISLGHNQLPIGHQLHVDHSKDHTGITDEFAPHGKTADLIITGHTAANTNLNQPHSGSSYYQVPFGVGNHHVQFKERVLGWAHHIYVDLLASIHQSRKEAHQERKKQGLQRSYSQTHIYPRPPRQTAFMLRRPSDPAHHTYATSPPYSQDFGQGHDAKPEPGPYRRRSNSLISIMEDKRSFANRAPLSKQNIGGSYFSSNPRSGDQGHNPLPLYPQVFPQGFPQRGSIKETAKSALEILGNLCQESGWRWIDGMLLGGCLAYGLEEYEKALDWYSKIVALDSSHVEAISNLAATLLSLNRREEAEQHWLRSVKLRPSYFEAVEHLIGLLCGDHRADEAISIIDFVERSLRLSTFDEQDRESDTSSDGGRSSSGSAYASEHAAFDFDSRPSSHTFSRPLGDDSFKQPGYGSSGYAIAGSDNGRMLALIHAKGNMLYAAGDISGASRAFEDAVLVSVGRRVHGIHGLIRNILNVVSSMDVFNPTVRQSALCMPTTGELMPVLLPPEKALRTAALVFSKHCQLPGLRYTSQGAPRTSAISTTSNSLLSLAKIFQDGMTNASQSPMATSRPCGTADILALYYLSLSLQPSPSTSNNIGILLASIPLQISDRTVQMAEPDSVPTIPGVKPGSGVALALAYYNYGLNLDSRHAHLYTNLGSLLKDIGQLTAAIKMYEQAVACDGQFDIALANLANAVKDQGRISDAIDYYKRAVASSPNFTEAVCGLANALNSVCDWTGRGGVIFKGAKYDRWHVGEDGMLCDAKTSVVGTGWMKRVVAIVNKQLEDGASWGCGTLNSQVLRSMLQELEIADTGSQWSNDKASTMAARLSSWVGKPWEGARVIRLIERAIKRAMHRWYTDKYVRRLDFPKSSYARPHLPGSLTVPGAPTVLPFHTFTCPLSAKDIRMISERNAMRISCAALRAPWLPQTVYPPPPPPSPTLNIGYISSDFNNHPLAHLMQSVFGMHDPRKAKAICYATTSSDNSVHRQQIEREAPVFRDTSGWPSDRLVQQIVKDEIHILVNLNGYTRGAKNEVFAARPAPIQMSFMGFAGTLGAEWCDYLLADETAIPRSTLRPWRRNIDLDDQLRCDESVDDEDWVYSENIIFCRDTFFCCDHRQSSGDRQLPWAGEQERRWKMRKELFPDLPDDVIILGNFNQLYKVCNSSIHAETYANKYLQIEPTTFRTWLRILANVPKAVLWLLRFPDLGESNLRRTARLWAGEEVASRILFTDVAPKNLHISRARICDLFLDTPECNAHTTAADILWSSTPLLTLPRYEYKMCSRMAASILKGALPRSDEGLQAASELIATDEEQYEEFAVKLARGLSYDEQGVGSGRLSELRRLLYENRCHSALFDTKRWVSDLERAYSEAWLRWVEGIGGDIYL